MFYKKISFEEESPSKEFYLLNNYLDKLPFVLNEITSRIDDMSIEEIDNMRTRFSISKIINETFQLLAQTRRDFKIEQINVPKELYTKLAHNGLVGDALVAKLSAVDWLWEKALSLWDTLRNGENTTLFYQLFNQLKSILSSLLNCLGFSADIFNEAIDLLMSFIEMSNQNYQA
jgi:hypothetical protein